MGMAKYILKRGLMIIPTVLIVVIINWLLIYLAPGDPAVVLAGELATPKQIETLRIVYGLNKPVYERIAIYLTRVFQGDLGYSFSFGTPVLRLIIEKMFPTLLLVVSANVVSFALGVPLGTYIGSKFPSKKDTVISILSLGSFSVPIFLMSLWLMLLFGFHLRWFPLAGMATIGAELEGIAYFIDVLWHLALPLLALTLFFLPIYLRVARANVIEIMQEDFITAVRASGFSERSIIYKHAMRNALLPCVTLLGLRLGLAFTGAIMTETVFSWPGLGKLLYDAIFARDYPLLSGIFIITSIMVVLATIVTDVLYGYIDPRVKVEG